VKLSKANVELSIKGESIQSLYGYYLSDTFLVNRRYQRKLVWTLDEKRAFIDSVIKGYPVPLILLADIISNETRRLEIIDGMQRLNAIMSFIEQEFDVNNEYFNLDSIADTKLQMDDGKLAQKGIPMAREICANIARYQIPLSVFQEKGASHVDEVFRRLNANGRHLSKQELRQAGATSKFASVVRKISCSIRGDSSASDILNLSAMKNISITSKNLSYGINVDDVFWIKNNIITRESLRESNDEEIIADIVAWTSIGKSLRSSSDILNQLYGFEVDDSDSTLAQQVEVAIQKINEEQVALNVQLVFDKLISILDASGKTFNALLFEKQQAKISRYFQIVYLTLFELIVVQGKDISNMAGLVKTLNKSGDKLIKLSQGGGNWSAKEKQSAIEMLEGPLKKYFAKSKSNDPTRQQWITRLENILMQSSTEQSLYDFKMGLHSLTKDAKFDKPLFSKIIKTLTAMANTMPGASGYCIIGIADTKRSANAFEKRYGVPGASYSNYWITGVDAEADAYHQGVDTYFTKLTQLIQSQPISDRDKDYIARNITTVTYFDKTVIILKIESGPVPSFYNGQYFVRHGSNIAEVLPVHFSNLFSRFPQATQIQN
jgi:hypothetical protein